MKTRRYKLKDIANQEAVRRITGYNFNFYSNISKESGEKYYPVSTDTTCYFTLKELNLIDLWFEEIEEEFKEGDYVVLMTNIHNKKLEKYSYGLGLAVAKVYQIATIESSIYSFKQWLHVNNNNVGGISANQFRYATKAEIEDYKKRHSMPVIDEYNPKIGTELISYGCIYVPKDALKQILNCANIEEITVNADGDLITIGMEELNQMKEFLNNN